MNSESAEGRGTPPKYHRDDGSPQMAERRKRFEHWYTVNAFDYARNPIGSERCDIRWRAWLAADETAAAFVGARLRRKYTKALATLPGGADEHP